MATASLFPRQRRLVKPGSAIWLMLHHIRTRLRGKAKSSTIQTIVRAVLLISILGFATYTTGSGVAAALTVLDGDYEYGPYIVKAGIMLSAFAISLLGSSLISAYAIFTDRDDLDLLLSSPIPPQRVLLARMLQGAYSAFFTASLMGIVTFGVSIVTLDLRFLLIFPVLFAFMIFDLAISFVIARALMLKLGVKRGRTVATVIGFITLMLGVMSFQLNSMIGTRGGELLLADLFGPNFTNHLEAFVHPIGRLAFGHPLETLGLFSGALAVFVGVGSFFWNRFGEDAAIMAGQSQQTVKSTSTRKIRFARGLFVNTVQKEWRSMLRDPFVLVQVATPLVSLIPIMVGLWALQRTGMNMDVQLIIGLIGFFAIQFGGQITGTLAWTAASIEEAGDLLLSSPSNGAQLFWSKAVATAIPSFLFLLIGMSIVGYFSVHSALWGLLVGTIGLACVGAVEFLRPRPARRAKMTQRPDRSIFSIMLGFTFSLVWAGATAMAITGMGFWTLIPIGVGLVAFGFVWATSPKSVVWMAKAPKVGMAGGPWKG